MEYEILNREALAEDILSSMEYDEECNDAESENLEFGDLMSMDDEEFEWYIEQYLDLERCIEARYIVEI